MLSVDVFHVVDYVFVTLSFSPSLCGVAVDRPLLSPFCLISLCMLAQCWSSLSDFGLALRFYSSRVKVRQHPGQGESRRSSRHLRQLTMRVPDSAIVIWGTLASCTGQ